MGKVNGTLLGCVPPGDELVFCGWVEEMLLGQVNVRPAPALQCTLGTGCMVSHGFTLEACLKELDEVGRDLRDGELLWYGQEERNKEWMMPILNGAFWQNQCSRSTEMTR